MKSSSYRESLTQQQVGQQEVAEVVCRHGQLKIVSCHLSLPRAGSTCIVYLDSTRQVKKLPLGKNYTLMYVNNANLSS